MRYISPINQGKIDSADRRYQLAQSIAGQSMAPQQGAASPLAALGKALTGYFAGQRMRAADAERQSALQDQQNQNKMDLSRAMSAYRQDTPYQMPQEQMFPGEQPIGGLKMEGRGQNMDAMIQALMESQNPNLQGMGFKAMMGGTMDGVTDPSSVREWDFYNSLSPEDQGRYLSMKRSGFTLGGQRYGAGTDAGNKDVVVGADETARGENTVELGKQAAKEGKRLTDTGMEVVEGSKAEREQIENKRKVVSTLTDLERQTGTVKDNINKALDLIGPFTTGAGVILSSLPESDAGKLRNTLQTIKANVGFDKLQRMRENSKTGGALGQVSEMENRLLQAVNGALDPKQSEQLRDNLLTIRDLYDQVLEEKRQAFEQDYGEPAPFSSTGTGYRTPEDVKAAFQRGDIDEGEAASILKRDFGYDD